MKVSLHFGLTFECLVVFRFVGSNVNPLPEHVQERG